MRYLIALALLPVPAMAQTATNPQGTRESGIPVSTKADQAASEERGTQEPVVPPAARGREGRILSRNEEYNLGRAAEGRVGARVGSDMSFRVAKKAAPQ
jgi:hypothetical protein